MHFQKRVEKLFTLMQYDDFFGDSGEKKYHLSSYFYRIEFQQRGAPHVHSLLWIKDSEDSDAPSFWSDEFDEDQEKDSEGYQDHEKLKSRLIKLEEKKAKIKSLLTF